MSEAPAAKVLEILAQTSQQPSSEITEATELLGDLGIDSPKALQVLVQIEDHFDIEIQDDEIAALRTVGDIVALVTRHLD